MSIDRRRRDEAPEQLPSPYATALRLRDAGIATDMIAECVGVERESLPTFIRIAEEKLAAAGYSD